MRFHCGISFSWRTIKKFLIPIIIGLLAFFGFSGITNDAALGIIKVNALENYNSNYVVTIPDYDSYLESYNCGTENVKSFIHNFLDDTDFSSTYYDLFIAMTISHSQLNFYLIPKQNGSMNDQSRFKYVGSSINNSNYKIQQYYTWYSSNSSSYRNYARIYGLTFTSCNTDISTSNSWLAFLNSLNNGVNNSTSDSVGYFSSNYTDFVPYYQDDSFEFVNSSITNEGDFETSLWFYYSSKDIYFSNFPTNTDTSSQKYYFKNIYLSNNDTIYHLDDQIPSYYDLIPTEPIDSTFIEYKNKLGTIYNNFNPSDISNFNMKIDFDTNNVNALTYHNNLSYNWSCYGRKNNNNNYYSYEKFSYCDFQDLGNYDFDSTHVNLTFNDFHIYDSNDNIITNFSNYDRLYIYIDFTYKDDSIDKTISSLVIKNKGSIYFSDYFLGPIYDSFEDLSLFFKMFISTNKSTDSFFDIRYSGSTITDKYFLYKQPYNTSSFIPMGEVGLLGTTFQRLSVNNFTQNGIMIYQQLSDLNSGVDLPKLEIIHFDDLIISFQTINSNTFYYVDSTGNITTTTIDINYDYLVNNNYDLEYYFRIVYNFIDSYKDKIWDLHLTIQSFYNSLPILLQNTIYVLFILLCISIIYKEIRR